MSEEKTALVKTEAPALALSGAVRINGFADVFTLAKSLSNARGFVPSQFIGQPDALAAVILTGVELGMGPMEAMRSLHVIEGKPTMSAEAMHARARRAGIKTRWVETSATKATIEVTAPGEKPQVMTFTIEEAKAAGLAGKGNWNKHPAAMLRARATSAAMRAFCPEVLGAGIYEADSGELTDGLPSNVIEAELVKPAAQNGATKEPTPMERLKACACAADVEAWCDAYSEKVRGNEGRVRLVVTKAAEFQVPELVAKKWLRMEPTSAPTELPDGSLSQDP